MRSLFRKLLQVLKYICEWESLPSLASNKRTPGSKASFLLWLLSPEKLSNASPKSKSSRGHEPLFKWLFSCETLPPPRNDGGGGGRESFLSWLFSPERLPVADGSRVQPKRKSFLRWLLEFEDVRYDHRNNVDKLK